jgi:hypothetical protein
MHRKFYGIVYNPIQILKNLKEVGNLNFSPDGSGIPNSYCEEERQAITVRI